METRKQMILDALDAFVRQRSGIDHRNYYDRMETFRGASEGYKAFRAEQRSIARDLRDYRALRLVVGLRTDVTADDLERASRDTNSGRLGITFAPVAGNPTVEGCGIDYCTGQYFPTEYRKAACAVMASALWARKRNDMPNPNLQCDGSLWWGAQKVSAGDWLRASFRKEFGRGIASRWFS